MQANDNAARHVITIMGAEKADDNSYIYYIDPNDESAPDSKTKIYKMIYDDFIKKIRDVYGCSSDRAAGSFLQYGKTKLEREEVISNQLQSKLTAMKR